MKLVAAFGLLTAAFGAFAALLVLINLGEQEAGDATIRFLACVALAVAGVVIARSARRGAARIDAQEAERLILRTARAHHGRVTATEVAVPLAQATEMLETLSGRGLCRMSIAQAGILVFEFPELAPAEHEEPPEGTAQAKTAAQAAAHGLRAESPTRPTSDRS